MLGMKRWQTVAKILFALVSIVLVTAGWGRVDKAHAAFWGRSRSAATQTTIKTTGKIAEASPPIALQELRQALDDYQPQVTILSPRKNEVLSDNTVSIRFLVKDLPLFKNETFGLGPHLHVLLDNRAYQAVYDTSQPLIFNDLEAGTHTIRAFASRPWHESFKNDGAFVQTTFHVFTKTQDNSPNPELPLLTYSRPQGTYGAEPILLDFYLTNAPLHFVAQTDNTDDIADWRIRCTVNGDSFVIDRWQPLYLKGFKPGKNWVQLEYLDDKGDPVPNVFNNTVRIVEYQPNGDDPLSKLMRGEFSAADVRGIVDPNYTPPAPTVEPIPEPSPSPSETPLLEPTPIPESTPVPEPTPTPESTPSLDLPDRPSSIAPLIPIPEPSPPSPEPTPEAAPSDETERQDAIAPPVPSPERPSEPETEPISPTPPDDATPPAAASVSGQERLRQVWQQLSRYLPQRRSAIRAPHTQVNAPSVNTVPNAELNPTELNPTEPNPTEPNPLPRVSIPSPLPPTLPEIIDAAPDASSAVESEPSVTGKPRGH